MKQSRMTLWRHRQAERAASNTDGGLPMPVPAGDQAKVSLAERYEYQERRRQHLEQHPGYDAAWERPTPETAAAVCALLGEYLPSLEAIHPDRLTAQQLVVIALDVAVSAGRYGKAQRRQRSADGGALLRHVRCNVTKTRLFDAIARRYSDHYRLARDTGRAFSVSQMMRSTVEAARRDLLRLEIALPTIWRLVVDAKWPLYSLRPSKREGYVVTLKPSPLLIEFERLVRIDPVYGPTRAEHSWRLWVHGQSRPAVSTHPQIIAERAVNVPTYGDGTQSVIELQADARLFFLSRVFLLDFEKITEKREALQAELEAAYPTKTAWADMTLAERQLRKQIRRLEAYRLEFQSIVDQIEELKQRGYPFAALGGIPIRSAFTKVLNRRFQSLHFFPMAVSAKTGRLDLPDAVLGPNGENDFSQRLRWFAFPGQQRAGLEALVSADISSSQTQLLAVLLGIKPLEQMALRPDTAFKAQLAQRAWEEHQRTGRLLCGEYDGPTDERLIAACKNLWLRIGYGSMASNVVLDHKPDWRNKAAFGPGWQDTKAVQTFLANVPGFPEMERFLDACRYIGQQAVNGLTLTDPLDGSSFMWNPIEAADVRVSWDGYEISLVAPGRYPGVKCPECGSAKATRSGTRRMCRKGHEWSVTFKPSGTVRETGGLPSHLAKLRNMTAPCLVHALDALYAAHVMRELHARGVRDFVSLHDAFYVPETLPDGSQGTHVLTLAMEAAGKPWLRALGPVYDFLAGHLVGTEWAPMIETARQKWADRVARQDWPVFSASPTT